MSITCDAIRDRFSELFESGSDAGPCADVKRHVDACPRCRSEFSAFVRSTAALQDFGRSMRTPAPAAYVASVMRAVDAAPATIAQAPFAKRRFARAASHLAAAALGAIGVWLLVPDRTPAPINTIVGQSSPTTPVAPIETVAARPRVTGDAVVVRAGREHVVAASGLDLEPGDVLRSDPGQSFALAFGGRAPIRFESNAPARVTAPPAIEVPVETVRYVNQGPLLQVDVDREWVEGVVRSAGTRIEQLAAAIESKTPPQPAPTSPEIAEQPPVAIAPTEPAAAFTPVETPASPVVLRRDGDLVTLETRGALYDVVPALLRQLDDPDPRVQQLVLRRLESIESELKQDPDIGDRLRDPSRPADSTVLGTVTGLFRSEKKAQTEFETPSKRWAAWWTLNARVVVDRGTWGTW